MTTTSSLHVRPILYAFMYIVMMLVIDVSYGIIDPRIRLGKGTTKMDDKKYEFLPDDFGFIGDKQNINIDEVAPARPAWKDVVYHFTQKQRCNLWF